MTVQHVQRDMRLDIDRHDRDTGPDKHRDLAGHNTFLKWAGVSISVVLTVIFAAAAVMAVGLYRLNVRSAPVLGLKVAGTPEQIERAKLLPTVLAPFAIRRPAPSLAAPTSARDPHLHRIVCVIQSHAVGAAEALVGW
jgi:hypothetical protein